MGESAPPKKRIFRAAGGNRTFKAVSAKYEYKEVIIVAKSTKQKANKKSEEIEDDELDALDELDDVEELEDEDEEDEEVEEEDEDEDEDDEDDEEDEAPAKKSKAKSKAKPSRAATTDGMLGTAEIAEQAGCDARTLRIFLRKHSDRFPKDAETNRYQWDKGSKVAAQIIKEVKAGGAKAAKQEGLDKLKASKAAKKEGTTKTKKAKKNKK